MLEYGPKDTCWAATYQKEDEQKLTRYFEKSATLGRVDNPMVIHFFDQMERRYNDHPARLKLQQDDIEIVKISKTSDIPTIQGIQYCCYRILAPVANVWRYHGVGNDTREPRAYQQRLFGETEPRADMTIPAQGSITRVSQSIRCVGIFPSTFPTITVRESAVFSNVTVYTGVMLNRQVFSATPITHTVNVAPFTVATDINFTADTTWG